MIVRFGGVDFRCWRGVRAELGALLLDPGSAVGWCGFLWDVGGFGDGSGEEECDGGAAPPHCTGPVAGEEEDADGEDVVVCYAVVGVAEVDAGD